MPKQRFERRIDKSTASTGSGGVTITGSGGGSGVTDHGALSGLTDDDHPQYHNNTRGDARYPLLTTYTTHVADTDAHHNQKHDFLGTDHQISGLTSGTLLVATGTSSMAFRGLTEGNAIDLTFDANGYTVDVDPNDLDGDGLGVSTTQLYVKTGNTTTIATDAVEVDESHNFAWTGNHTHTGTIGYTSFSSGFTGSGWRLDYGVQEATKSYLELDNLTVRGRLSVYELLVRQIRATNGNLFVSAAAKIASVSGAGPYVLTVEGEDGTDYQPFAVGDLIRAQRNTGASTHQVNLQVTAITTAGDTRAFTATLTSGDTPAAGMEFVRLGNTSDGDRQGAVYLSVDDTYAPYIDIVDGVDSFADWNTFNVLKLRLGNLDGLTDPVLGVLSGYGMYGENVNLTGRLTAADGDFIVNDSGVFIQAESTGSTTWGSYDTKITLSTDPTSPADTNTVGQMWGSKYSDAGTVYNELFIETRSDVDSGTDVSYLTLQAQAEPAAGSIVTGALVQLRGGPDSDIYLYSMNDDGSAGSITLQGEVSLGSNAHIVPNADGTLDLGSATYAFRSLYVDTIYAGTTSSTDTGHNHHDLYYTESEVDTLLGAKAASSHTHAGVATVAYVDTGLAGKSDTSHTHDSRYYTESETDALLANKSATGHTHDSRYYTESEVDTLLGGYSVTGHTHDSRYYTQSTVDSLLTGYSATSHTHSSLTGTTLTLTGTAQMDLADGTGTYGQIDRTGIVSVDPAFVSGDNAAGVKITWAGTVSAREIEAVTLRSFVFEMQQQTLVGNSMILSTGGRLDADLSIPSAVGGTGTLDLADPDTGSPQLFQVGDVVRISATGYGVLQTNAATANLPGIPLVPYASVAGAQQVGTTWLEITAASGNDGFWRYSYEVKHGTTSIRYPAGTAVARWGQSGDGLIRLSSDDAGGYTPFVDISTVTATPWTGDTSIVRLGRLDGLSHISGAEQYGLSIASPVDDGEIVASSVGGIYTRQLTQRLEDGSGNTTVYLSPDTGINLAVQDNVTASTSIQWLEDATDTPTGSGSSAANSLLELTCNIDTDIDSVRLGPYARIATHGQSGDTESTLVLQSTTQQSTLVGGASVSLVATDTDSTIDLSADFIQISNGLLLVTGPQSAIESDTATLGDLTIAGVDGLSPVFKIENCPISATGLPSGAIYNDNGTLKIVS